MTQAVLSDFSDIEKAQFNDFLTRIQTNCTRIMQSAKAGE